VISCSKIPADYSYNLGQTLIFTFYCVELLAFFVLWSVLISAMFFAIVPHDLIFYIQSSWTPKNFSVDPCWAMDPGWEPLSYIK